MDVEFSKSFDKQTSLFRDKILLKRVSNIIKKVIECKTLNEIPNLKPIVGHPGFIAFDLGIIE